MLIADWKSSPTKQWFLLCLERLLLSSDSWPLPAPSLHFGCSTRALFLELFVFPLFWQRFPWYVIWSNQTVSAMAPDLLSQETSWWGKEGCCYCTPHPALTAGPVLWCLWKGSNPNKISGGWPSKADGTTLEQAAHKDIVCIYNTSTTFPEDSSAWERSLIQEDQRKWLELIQSPSCQFSGTEWDVYIRWETDHSYAAWTTPRQDIWLLKILLK